MAKRLQAMGNSEYKNGFIFKTLPGRLDLPKRVKQPTRFFVNSMSDLFHEKMPYSFLDKVFKVIEETPWHTYQILTKRDEILADYFSTRAVPENVWLGVTVESKAVKKRIDALRKINATIKFLSVEPLLEDLGKLNLKNIDWVIVGGESGVSARPMLEEWVVSIKEQCEKNEIAFFFKQWGTWGADGIRRNKKDNGSILLGREWKQEPELELCY
jgi:protein gp37